MGLQHRFALIDLLVKYTLGFGFVGLMIMVLCFFYICSPMAVFLSLAGAGIFVFPFIYNELQDFIEWFRNGVYLKNLVLTKWFWALPFIVLLTGYIARSLLPPTGFDSLMYHLSIPKLYLENGGFWNVYFNPQSDFPMLAEMNYLVGLAFENDLVCRQIALGTGLLALGCVIVIAKACVLSKREQLISGTLFLTLTVVIATMSNCDVDMISASAIVLSVLTIKRAFEEKNGSLFMVSAMLAGIAMGTKIFGVFVIPLIVYVAAREGMFRLHYKQFLRKICLFACFTLPFSIPWYAKSFVYRGTVISISSTLLEEQGLGMPMGIGTESPIVHFLVNVFLRTIAAPWTFSLFPSQHQGDTLGPLFIAIFPLMFIFRIPQRMKVFLAIMGIYLAEILFMEIFFIPGGASIRYCLPVAITGIPIAMYLVRKLETYPVLHKVVMVIVWFQMGLGVLLFAKRYHKDWIALLTMQSKEEYYQALLPEYDAIHYINQLPGSATVFIVYNYSNYLIEKPYVAAYRRYKSPDMLRNDLREKNIRYIFANNTLDTTENRDALPEISNKKVLFNRNGYYVFLLED